MAGSTKLDTLEVLREEYDRITDKVISVLRHPSEPTHFEIIRMYIDRLEEIDSQLTNSNVIRQTIDVPKDDF